MDGNDFFGFLFLLGFALAIILFLSSSDKGARAPRSPKACPPHKWAYASMDSGKMRCTACGFGAGEGHTPRGDE